MVEVLRAVTDVVAAPVVDDAVVAAPATVEVDDPFVALLDDARNGDQRAWTDLYRSVAGKLRSYAAAQGAADPDDLVGDVFVQVARNIGRFTGTEAGFRSWVFMIAHSRVVDARRAARRRPPPVELDPDDDATAGSADAAETAALDRLAAERVDEHLASLTEDQRQVMLLRYLGDLTLEEVAGATGRPLGAVKQLHRRALRSIRRNIDRAVPG